MSSVLRCADYGRGCNVLFMSETKVDWNDLQLFLAVARGGGLSPAAAETGKSAPTLGRRMLALERELGQELFRRLARGYTLTEQGTALMQQVSQMEEVASCIVR